MDDKQAIYSAWLGWVKSKGMKEGAAYHKFKDMVGHYPSNKMVKECGAMVESVQKWIIHEQIKCHKSNFLRKAA